MSTSMMPASSWRSLTVILPVFNAMPYLPTAVQSILTQTYADLNFLAMGRTHGESIGKIRAAQSRLTPRNGDGSRPSSLR
jgi:hypothetical protein